MTTGGDHGMFPERYLPMAGAHRQYQGHPWTPSSASMIYIAISISPASSEFSRVGEAGIHHDLSWPGCPAAAVALIEVDGELPRRSWPRCAPAPGAEPSRCISEFVGKISLLSLLSAPSGDGFGLPRRGHPLSKVDLAGGTRKCPGAGSGKGS